MKTPILLGILAMVMVGCANRETGREVWDRNTKVASIPTVQQRPGYYEVWFSGGVPNEYTLDRPELATTHHVYLQTKDGVVTLPSMGASFVVNGTAVTLLGLQDYPDAMSAQIDY